MNSLPTVGWRRVFMVGALAGGFWFGSTAAAADDERPYWICTDVSGAKSAQDRPCENDPRAEPSGTIAKSKPPDSSSDGGRSETIDVLAPDFWKANLERLKTIPERVQGQSLSIEPVWIFAGGGLILTSLSLWFIFSMALPGLRQRRAIQAELRSPDLYRKAIAENCFAPTLDPVASVPVEASRWSKPLVEALTLPQLIFLAEQLFVARAVCVERLSTDESVLFLKKDGPDMPRYGVVLCRTEGQGAEHGARLVRELLGLMSMHGVEYGAVVAPGQFDTAARDSARGSNVELKGSQTLLAELEGLSDADRSQLLFEVQNH